MATTSIEWTDTTWNPVTGCDRIDAACDRCYALTLAKRLKAMGQPRYQRDGDPRTSGPGFGVTLHHDLLVQPLTWTKPRRVFVNSMSDVFHAKVPQAFIQAMFVTMQQASWHTFQVLTKREPRARQLASSLAWPANVWLGTSVGTRKRLRAISTLVQIPAAVRFLSLEPLLEPLPGLDLAGIDWVIIGGESGQRARACQLDWIRDIRDQCQAAGVPVFVKQIGSVWARQHGIRGQHRSKGQDGDDWPDDLRIREMPRDRVQARR
jgi:protein gp37